MQKVDLRVLSRQTMALANAVAYHAEKALDAEKETERVMYLRNVIECIERLMSTKETLEGMIRGVLNDNN